MVGGVRERSVEREIITGEGFEAMLFNLLAFSLFSSEGLGIFLDIHPPPLLFTHQFQELRPMPGSQGTQAVHGDVHPPMKEGSQHSVGNTLGWVVPVDNFPARSY